MAGARACWESTADPCQCQLAAVAGVGVIDYTEPTCGALDAPCHPVCVIFLVHTLDNLKMEKPLSPDLPTARAALSC